MKNWDAKGKCAYEKTIFFPEPSIFLKADQKFENNCKAIFYTDNMSLIFN